MKKIIFTICFMLIIFFTVFNIKSFAENKITLNADNYSVQKDEEITITANISKEQIAAYTIFIYYDKDKVECITNKDNINVLEDKIIYTWVSETGQNKEIEELVNLKFKAKQNGIALFNVIAEIYNEKGEKIDVNYTNIEVKIEENAKNNSEQENREIDDNPSVKDDDATLEIMRVNREGINPNFDKNVKEYYLLIDKDVKDLDITAIPSNKDAKVDIIGNKNLKNGLNKVEIKVTSKDKSKTNEYIINVTKTNDFKNSNADLEILAVEYFKLTPEFDKNVTNYFVEVSNKVDKLNIFAVPVDEDAKNNISGNENLKVGNNKIVISVTARDGVTEKKYYINAYRRNTEEDIENEEEQKNIIKEANSVLEKMNNNSENNEESTETEKENSKKIIKYSVIVIGGIFATLIITIIIKKKIAKRR